MGCEKHPRYETRTFNLICEWLYILCCMSLIDMQDKKRVFSAAISGHWHAVSCLPQFCISPRQPFRKKCLHPTLVFFVVLYCEYFILTTAAHMQSMWPANAIQRALWIFKGKHTSNNHSCFQLGGFLLWEHGTCALCTYGCLLTLLAVHVCWTQPRQEQISCSHNLPQEEFLSHTLPLSLKQSIPC